MEAVFELIFLIGREFGEVNMALPRGEFHERQQSPFELGGLQSQFALPGIQSLIFLKFCENLLPSGFRFICQGEGALLGRFMKQFLEEIHR